ncbi:hypothetical protein JOB18_047682 [Solea senegalensis]|uniref:Uncharacterized protein n=1 Tax=Solea senegalensis TaxID=28829 RepID=A0AAV6RY41_SOLSE|nr:hypothetical protein JOB18_047682 [Solea senegalensis]
MSLRPASRQSKPPGQSTGCHPSDTHRHTAATQARQTGRRPRTNRPPVDGRRVNFDYRESNITVFTSVPDSHSCKQTSPTHPGREKGAESALYVSDKWCKQFTVA